MGFIGKTTVPMLTNIRDFLQTHVKNAGDDVLKNGEDKYGKYIHWQSSRTDGVLRTYIVRFYGDKKADGKYLVRLQINRDVLRVGYPSMKYCSSVEEFKQIFEKFLQTV